MGREEKTKITPVYLKSSSHTWVPALQLKTHNGKATVSVPNFKDEKDIIQCDSKGRFHDNQTVDLSDYPNNVLPMQNVDSNGNLEEYKDMVDLPFLHEAAILYNLKLRHIREKPYTRTGDIVIAVNPYQWYHGLYTEEKRSYYSNRLVWERSEEDPRAVMEPHVYEVSSLAYKGLAFGSGENQSILVSGESGAGKTETVKICLNHIASVQRGQVPPGYFGDSVYDHVVQRVVQSNPLLEAFGNAKTRRNDNSSRFGKYLQLQFDKDARTHATVLNSTRCGLVGSKCDVYLLEKNRVVNHDSNERTYHIFYQLLAASDTVKAHFWEGLRGTKNESFKYVGPTETDTIEGMKDTDRFGETVAALGLVGVRGDSLNALMQAMCIVLQLGNLGFKALKADSDKSAVATKEELKALSKLMGVSKGELTLAFTERTFTSGSDTYKVPLNPEAAKEACDALAKEAYQKSFLWLVGVINKATCAVEWEKCGTIGLLDIFGFEVFPTNRFEQLCINYANEKLQQKFTEDIFTNVQLEYQSEGISLEDIWYDDNTDVLDLIEGRTGLLNLLNEECIRPKGNDFDFVQKSLQINKAAPALIVHKTDRMSFGIRHYAGEVMYDGQYFVNKNLDTLPTDLQECAEKCSNAIISAKLSDSSVATGRNNNSLGARNSGGGGRVQSNIAAATVWTKYKNQLSELMGNLHQTQSRYIRCVKPNSKKQPHLMEHETSVDQLRCAGVVAGITISRSVFPNRLPNSVAFARYSSMWDTKNYPSKKNDGMTLAEKRAEDCKALMEAVLKSKEVIVKGKVIKAFVVGKTRTYFRAGVLEWLESGRMRGLDTQATTIQRAARGWLVRNKGRYEKQHKKMEEAAREAARQAEIERKARLAREAAERKAEHQRDYQKMLDKIAKLERGINEYEKEQNAAIRAARERAEIAKNDIEEMKACIALEEEHGAKQSLVELAEQEKKLEEHKKLIAYLKKENTRARKENEKYRTKLKAEKCTSALVEESHRDMSENVDYAEELAVKEVMSHKTVNQMLDEVKINCERAKKEVMNHQEEYLQEAQIRLQFQKSVARLVKLTQENVRDKNIVEEVVVIALGTESNAKAIMAALDMETTEAM